MLMRPLRLLMALRKGASSLASALGENIDFNSPLSQGGHIAPGDQKSFVLPR